MKNNVKKIIVLMVAVVMVALIAVGCTDKIGVPEPDIKETIDGVAELAEPSDDTPANNLMYYTADNMSFEDIKKDFKDDITQDEIDKVEKMFDEAFEIAKKSDKLVEDTVKFSKQLYAMDIFKPEDSLDDLDATASVENKEEEIWGYTDFQKKLKDGLSEQKQKEIKALYKKMSDAEDKAFECQDAIGNIYSDMYLLDVFDYPTSNDVEAPVDEPLVDEPLDDGDGEDSPSSEE